MTGRVTRVNPADLPDTSAIGYAQISVAGPGRMAFVSGQVASSDPVAGDFDRQAAEVMEKGRRALAALGAGPDDIVMARLYVVDLDNARLARTVHHFADFCAGATPSLTGVGVSALAGAGLLIEMELQVLLPV